MDRYFLDSCALAKRYLAEPGQTWIQDLCASGSIIYISQLATVEVVTAIRRGTASQIERAHGQNKQRLIRARHQLIQTFQDHCNTDYAIRVLTPATFERAALLAGNNGIQSLDAVQLAGAILAQEYCITNGLDVPAFISADVRLLKIAQRHLSRLDNPEEHRLPDEESVLTNDWRAKAEKIGRRVYEYSMRLNRGR